MGEGGNKQTHNQVYDVQQEVTSAVVETSQVKWWPVAGGGGCYLGSAADSLSEEMTFKLNPEW